MQIAREGQAKAIGFGGMLLLEGLTWPLSGSTNQLLACRDPDCGHRLAAPGGQEELVYSASGGDNGSNYDSVTVILSLCKIYSFGQVEFDRDGNNSSDFSAERSFPFNSKTQPAKVCCQANFDSIIPLTAINKPANRPILRMIRNI